MVFVAIVLCSRYFFLSAIVIKNYRECACVDVRMSGEEDFRCPYEK